MMQGAKYALVAAPMLVLGLASCATTHGSLERSADSLNRNSQVLAADARAASDHGRSSSSSIARDSQRLARRAREFRSALADRGPDSPAVRSAFDSVARSYHHVREDVRSSGTMQEQRDLKSVTRAYLDTEDRMGGYPPDHRYASSDGDSDGG